MQRLFFFGSQSTIEMKAYFCRCQGMLFQQQTTEIPFIEKCPNSKKSLYGNASDLKGSYLVQKGSHDNTKERKSSSEKDGAPANSTRKPAPRPRSRTVPGTPQNNQMQVGLCLKTNLLAKIAVKK